MPIFKPFSSKSKGGQPKKRISNKEEMSYTSNEEDLLAHLGNLQLEVSRLHHQLASIQSQHHQARAKEEVSTQRSRQTFSTIGTTQPNHSSSGDPRPSSRHTPSPRYHDRHKPESDYSSRDRPPPVAQIFIPTPSNSYQTSTRHSHHRDYHYNRNVTDSVAWLDDDARSPLQHYPFADNNVGDDCDVVPRYVRTGGITAEFVPTQRLHTGSGWQTHHSSHSSRPTGSTSSDRIPVRAFKRLPDENPYGTSTTNPRHNPTAKPGFDQRLSIEDEGEYTHGGRLYVPRTVYRGHKCDDGDQALLSNNKRQYRVVWPATEQSEEASSVSSTDYQVLGRPFNKDQHHDQSYQQTLRYKTRESHNSQSHHGIQISLESFSQEPSRPPSHAAVGIPPALSSTNKKGHHDNILLLSQIQKQRLNLKSARDRPEKIPYPKDHVDLIFEAIQNGVPLKHVETPIKNFDDRHKSPPNDMLLQLQERKNALGQCEEVKQCG